MFKKIIIFILGGKQFFIVKFLSVLKNSIINYIKIFPLIKRKIFFFIKMFQSQYFITFHPVKYEEKKIINSKNFFIYPDWFSNNINVWKKFLIHISNFNYLEIGTFEGRSAIFVSELNNCEKIVCVDPYVDYNEVEQNDFNMSDVYESVNQKFKQIKNKDIKLIKETSDNFFLKNKESFKVIYIDGYHKYENVKRDFINAMNCLDDGGILICDDFLWFFYEKIEQNPIGAILECYENYKKDLEILFIHHQIIFKKTKLCSLHIV